MEGTARPAPAQYAGVRSHTTQPRPRTQPSVWRAARHRRRRGRRPHDPRKGPAKGTFGLGFRLRRVIWSWWLWAALAIWMLATDHWWWATGFGVAAILSHLVYPRSESPRFGLDHEFSVDSAEFLTTMAGATGVPYIAGNTFEILNNGDAFYPRMLADIRAARHSITMEAYIYWAGEIGAEFAAALAERAKAGVRVVILLDAVGSSDIGDDTIRILEDGGCHVDWYNPLHWKTLGRFNNRTHRKSLIVDGEIAYTGGAGIADHWKGNARGPEEWRDIQIRFEGPAVIALQTGFAHNWQQTTGEVVTGDAFYPVVEPRGPHALQVILSSPELGGSSVQTMYYLAIACARKSIYIANPYFVPDAVAVEMLREAKRRGVDVHVMVSGLRNDNWLARRNSVRLFGRLLEMDIPILEYNRSMMHHKVMVVDSRWVTIGSTNFDARSFAHNEESNVCLYDPGVARDMERVFHEDARICEPVSLQAWRRRGVVERAGEVVAFLLEDQV
jgi:cardiolipin synthase